MLPCSLVLGPPGSAPLLHGAPHFPLSSRPAQEMACSGWFRYCIGALISSFRVRSLDSPGFTISSALLKDYQGVLKVLGRNLVVLASEFRALIEM